MPSGWDYAAFLPSSPSRGGRKRDRNKAKMARASRRANRRK